MITRGAVVASEFHFSTPWQKLRLPFKSQRFVRDSELFGFLSQEFPDLALIAERWRQLPDALRASIVAMVRATGTGGTG